ncbi:hypothetical protein [Rhizobium paknamense]|uniref:Histidine kinase n=1 Tax=Rhizobium paknamense TaxID=1206817 RepID=A0ABU0IFY4_9HYPH|nr:hypothetical protein [Rhizobium paknamense]MDQ0456548.1 hypothetical protein [Rhizobium paknamense]
MPSLFRLLFIVGVIAGFVYVAMWCLVIFVEPKQRDITVKIPASRIEAKPVEASKP